MLQSRAPRYKTFVSALFEKSVRDINRYILARGGASKSVSVIKHELCWNAAEGLGTGPLALRPGCDRIRTSSRYFVRSVSALLYISAHSITSTTMFKNVGNQGLQGLRIRNVTCQTVDVFCGRP